MSSPLTPGTPGPGGSAEHTQQLGHTTPAGTGAHDTGHGGHGVGHGNGHSTGSAQQFGDLKVSAGAQAAYVTLELILYVITAIAIFVTAAVIDEEGSGQGFGASEAWFYVTLLTVGLFISRGLAKIGQRGSEGTRTL